MQFFADKRVLALLALGVVVISGLVAFFALRKTPEPGPREPVVVEEKQKKEVIGISVEGRPIEAYTYGTGDTMLLFVGGVHGGYEWNSILLSYQFMDYVEANPSVVLDNLTVAVIPNLNPDGLFKVIGKVGRFSALDVPAGSTAEGRFNARGVDLNRNLDCKWKSESMWRGNVVSAGTAPFSEPETQALRDYVVAHTPAGVVFWHSQSNAVYASECENGILPGTRAIMNAYAKASGYPPVDVFDAYEITGDAEGWLASIGIPAITVELSTHETIEWERNLVGIKALLQYYRK